MGIRQLSLTDFRNLQSTTLDFHPQLNFITGVNGSGKTSLLEAIHVLSQARSFRQKQLKKCIQHGKQSFMLFGQFSDFKAGLSKSDNQLQIRVNGESVKKRSLLVSRAPVNVLNSDSFELITGSPEQRRRYLDWCLFHVEHSYTNRWTEFRHALRQRNKLLKTKQNIKLLDYWDEYLIKPSLVLRDMRRKYCSEISGILNQELSGLLNELNIDVSYQQGWSESETLQESLEKSRTRDIRSGFTNTGIHRDNILILSDGNSAVDVLSRGQLKRLSLALLVAALKIVRACSQQPIILLMDDLEAEMDEDSCDRIYQSLFDIDLQLFVTNINDAVPGVVKRKDFKMFHVEHGMIKPRKFN